MINGTIRRAITALIVVTGVCVLAACSKVETDHKNETDATASYDRQDPDYGTILGQEAPSASATSSGLLDLNRPTDQQVDAYDAWFIEHEARHLQNVADLVAFPTLAMVPDNAQDLIDAGEYLVEKLTSIGMQNAKVHPADGFPLVTAEWFGAEGQPTGSVLRPL